MSRNVKWTTDEMGDLSDQVTIVTGANTGLGYETARELMAHGAHVVVASRNTEKATDAIRRLESDAAAGSSEFIPLDLADLASVRSFATSFSGAHDRLDLLINNAGIMMVPKARTADGFERQLGTNHLGHFALTGLLLDQLQNTADSRVVTVSSLAHRSGSMDFDNLMYVNGGYSPTAAYGRSKLANLLFTYELDRRLKAAGSTTVAVAAHPGVSATDLGNHLVDQWYTRPLQPLLRVVLQGAAAGAQPTLRAATDPTVEGGEYFGPGGFQESRGAPKLVTSTSRSHDEADAARLWEVSSDLTGVNFAALG